MSRSPCFCAAFSSTKCPELNGRNHQGRTTVTSSNRAICISASCSENRPHTRNTRESVITNRSLLTHIDPNRAYPSNARTTPSPNHAALAVRNGTQRTSRNNPSRPDSSGSTNRMALCRTTAISYSPSTNLLSTSPRPNNARNRHQNSLSRPSSAIRSNQPSTRSARCRPMRSSHLMVLGSEQLVKEPDDRLPTSGKGRADVAQHPGQDRKSTRLNSSHV